MELKMVMDEVGNRKWYLNGHDITEAKIKSVGIHYGVVSISFDNVKVKYEFPEDRTNTNTV